MILHGAGLQKFKNVHEPTGFVTGFYKKDIITSPKNLRNLRFKNASMNRAYTISNMWVDLSSHQSDYYIYDNKEQWVDSLVMCIRMLLILQITGFQPSF